MKKGKTETWKKMSSYNIKIKW